MHNEKNHNTDRDTTFLGKLRDIVDEFIVGLFVLWDDEVVKPYQKWRAKNDIGELLGHHEVTHHFSLGRGWMLTLLLIFLFWKFFPEQVANLPGVSWAFDFVAGLINLAFELARRFLSWFFSKGEFPSPRWLFEAFKALL